MKKSSLDRLVKITGDLEDIVLSIENMTKGEVDARVCGLYVRMTEIVGGIMLEHDEMEGQIE